MSPSFLKTATIPLLALLSVTLPMGCSGSDGPPGPAARNVIDASTASDVDLAKLDVVSEISSVTIASRPVITFTLHTSDGVPIVGLVPFWEDSNRFVRFTITKLVPGRNGDPDSWVAYVRDAGTPDYDTGASLVDNDDGTYTFTFNTDVTKVDGVAYEPTLTHRVAGQIGRYSTVPLEEQNIWLEFVPDGSPVTRTRKIAVMTTCNECHQNLVFHGRRFKVEYCVQCHNPDNSQGEGNFSFMIHRIHNAGKFHVLDGGVSFEEVTYPQDVTNCRKCHNAEDAETPQAENWRILPNMAACDGCHDVFNANAKNTHTGGQQTDNSRCVECHSADDITLDHTTPNATPNNPELLPGQHKITYELIDAAVDATTNVVTVKFKILSDGVALDVTKLPAEFKDGNGAAFRYPGLLLAWTQPQGNITAPADYNNSGRTAGQPLSLSLGSFSPIESTNPIGTLAYNAMDGVMTATVTVAASQFPAGAKMRAVGLQGYLQQDLDNDGGNDVSLHALSAVVPVSGDDVRRQAVDPSKCAQCHEWFEGHGGNRVFGVGSDLVCVMCHVPNLSSSGRTLDLKHPEDAQNFKDMIHGIHSSGFRTRAFTHVRNFRNGASVYDWSEVTFPRGASTRKCTLCHLDGAYELPLADGLLPTTVRTTGVATGEDAKVEDVATARANVPNATDWVNSPMGSSCFYCHTSQAAWAHMVLSGAQLSNPGFGLGIFVNRSALGGVETCAVCHGPGKVADLEVVHKL